MISSDSATFYVHLKSTSIRFSVLLNNFGLMPEFYSGKLPKDRFCSVEWAHEIRSAQNE